jgi:hypothetical protein
LSNSFFSLPDSACAPLSAFLPDIADVIAGQ